MQSFTSGAGENCAFGSQALKSTTGNLNCAFGYNCLQGNTTGSFNNGFGYFALGDNFSGTANVAMGARANYQNSTGSANTVLGDSGMYTNTVGSYNTCLGFMANVGSNNLVNATAIGNSAIVTGSNAMVMGNTAVTSFEFSGSLQPGVGNDGTLGYMLVSGGAGASPIWSNLTVNQFSNPEPFALNYTAQTFTFNWLSSNNLLYGSQAGSGPLNSGTSGNQLFGIIAGGNLRTGNSNTLFGFEANEGGGNNYSGVCAFGYQAAKNNTGSFLIAIGDSALVNTSAGTDDIGIGHFAHNNGANDTNVIILGSYAKGNGSNTATIGNVNNVSEYVNSTATVVNCSTSGTVTFTQPEAGAYYKYIIIYCSVAVGTATYTFAKAFTNTPGIVVTYNGTAMTGAIVTSLSTTAVTITGGTSTGFIFLNGF